MINYVLFDFDGTVFNTLEGITRCVEYAAEKQGLHVPPEDLKSFAGPPLTEKFMEYFGISEERAWQALLDFRVRYADKGIHESELFEGITEAVDRLIAAGKTVAIATSKPERATRTLLTEAGIIDRFGVIIGGPSDGRDFTKLKSVTLAMEAVGAVPEETILVGDRKYDVEGAHQAGIRCLGVRYGFAEKGELEAAGADLFAATPEEIADVILGSA